MIIITGGAGFIGFNNRFRPDQLKQGVLADSQNGRMDLNGEWQVRKGIDVISGSLLISGGGIDVGSTTLDDTGTQPALVDSAVPTIRASCAFSDPTDSRNQFIVIALATKAKLVNLVNRIVVDIDYPVGTFINDGASLLQAFDKVFLFRKGETTLIWDGNSANDFEKALSGDFVQPTRLGNVSNNTSITDGVATVTSTAHGLSTGDEIVVIEAPSSLTVNDTFVVNAVTTDTFSFDVEVDNTSADIQCHYIEPLSGSLGFIRLPAPRFGIYHNHRLVVPYEYQVNSTADSFTDRNIKDQLLLSNGLAPQKFNDLKGKFRLNAGTADFIVGFHSFSEDKLIVFNRNSIHLISNTNALNNSVRSLITNEIGCVAKNSIVQVGNTILFLSDNGIYGVSFQDLYNLRGNDVPLSESIDPTIKEINKEYWSKSVAVYFDNRYYIAVPVGLGANKNNKIIIYNFLNKQWESIDSVDNESFDFDNLIVAGDKSNRGVYAVNSLGGVHKIESREDGIDRITSDPSTAGVIDPTNIKPSITTRQFTVGTLDKKKWNTFEINTESSLERASNFVISAETENIDYNLSLGTLSDRLGGSDLARGEDVSIRGRIGNSRAYGIQFTLNNMTGRPRIKSIKTTGAQAFRSTNTAI